MTILVFEGKVLKFIEFLEESDEKTQKNIVAHGPFFTSYNSFQWSSLRKMTPLGVADCSLARIRETKEKIIDNLIVAGFKGVTYNKPARKSLEDYIETLKTIPQELIWE